MAADKPIPLDILLALKDVEKLEKGFESLKNAAGPFADAVDRALAALDGLSEKEGLLAKVIAAGTKVRAASTKATGEAAAAGAKAAKAADEQTKAQEDLNAANEEAVKGWKALTAEEYRNLAAAKAAGQTMANLVRVGTQWYDVTDELVPQFKLLGTAVNSSMATSAKSATLLTRTLGELSDEVKALPGAAEALAGLGSKAAEQLKRETANGGRSLAMLMDEQKAAYTAAADSSNKLLGNIRDLVAEHVPFGRALAGVFDELEKVAQAESDAKKEGEGLAEGLAQGSTTATAAGGRYEALTKIIGSLRSAKGLALLAAGGLAAALTTVASAAVGAAQDHAQLVKRVQDEARATGLSTEAFSRYRVMFNRVGLDLREGAEIFSELNDRTTEAREGSKGHIETFERLGISVQQLNGPLRSSEALLETLAERFVEANREGRDLAERQKELKSIQELLGDELYKKLLPAFAEGAAGIARFREEADKTGVTLKTEAIEGVNQYNEAVRNLGIQWDTLTTRMASSLGDVILPVLASSIKGVNYATDYMAGRVDNLYNAGTQVATLQAQLDDTTRAMQALAQTPGVGQDPVAVRKIQDYAALVMTLTDNLASAKVAQAELQKASGSGSTAAPAPRSGAFVGPVYDADEAGKAYEKSQEDAKKAAEKAAEDRKRALEELQSLEVAAARETDNTLEDIQRSRAERLADIDKNAKKAGVAGAAIAARARLETEEAYQQDLQELTEQEADAWAQLYKDKAEFTLEGERTISREQRDARLDALKQIQGLRDKVVDLHQQETDSIAKAQAEQLAALKTALNDSLLTQEEYEQAVTDAHTLGAQKRTQSDRKELETRAGLAQQGADLLSQVWSDISDQYEEELQERSDAVERHETLAGEVTTKLERVALQEKIKAERAKLVELRKAAVIAHRIAQSTALAAIGIDTAMGAQKAYSQNPLPSPVGLVSAGLVTGAGIVAAAKVALEPPPKYRAGGLVRGASHEAGGVMAELEGGEFIMRREAVRALGPGLLTQLNQGDGGTVQAPPVTVNASFRIGEQDVAITIARAVAASSDARAILRSAVQ